AVRTLYLYSFPTRRSSDLSPPGGCSTSWSASAPTVPPCATSLSWTKTATPRSATASTSERWLSRDPKSSSRLRRATTTSPSSPRSEEHTSELQSRGQLVSR